MPRIRLQQTNFAAGELAPALHGRVDLRAYQSGAARLRNVMITASGAIARRPGLRFVDTVRGAARLVPFEISDAETYLLVFTDHRCDVYLRDRVVAAFGCPWTVAQLSQINYTQSADALFIVHPETPPKRITRHSITDWDLGDWPWRSEGGRIGWPHYKFAPDHVTITASATTGNVLLIASEAVFRAEHVGCRLRIQDKEVHLTSILSATQARADCKETLATPTATTDWREQALSPVRGWPVSVCFHQNRLVLGGSRDLPNRLWLSRSADLFNFDLGSGLDDEGIDFPLLSDQANSIRHVFSTSQLQVFTSGGEWTVAGQPLTPSNIQVNRQTRLGSRTDRTTPPRDVDGITVFIPRWGDQVRELAFSDSQQLYQAADLGLLASHLLQDAIDLDFDKRTRQLHVVMADGSLATLTIYREEGISAWTGHSTEGAFRGIAAVGGTTYFLVERNSGYFLEAFDPELLVDCGARFTDTVARRDWTALGHLEGETIQVVADDIFIGERSIVGGRLSLPMPANTVQGGLAFTHTIVPLPPATDAANGHQGRCRPVSVTFRLSGTRLLVADIGDGLRPIPLFRLGEQRLDHAPAAYSGPVTVRMSGWRPADQPLWRIEQSEPSPFQVISVATELMLA